MYNIPPDIISELGANKFLTTKAIEFLLNAAIEEVIGYDDVFIFPVGIMVVIDRDLVDFKGANKNALLWQRWAFYRSDNMYSSTDIIFPVLDNGHYYIFRLLGVGKGCEVHVHDSIGISRRKNKWNEVIDNFLNG